MYTDHKHIMYIYRVPYIFIPIYICIYIYIYVYIYNLYIYIYMYIYIIYIYINICNTGVKQENAYILYYIYIRSKVYTCVQRRNIYMKRGEKVGSHSGRYGAGIQYA